MPNEKKYFAADGFLDSDTAPFAIATNSWINAENVRSATTDAGVVGTMESIGSNILVSQALPSVTFLTIGKIDDPVNNRHIKFNFNTTGTNHKIVCFYANSNTEYVVLYSAQVTGGLNFSKNYPIHSVRIVNGLLYWTDNLNAQRKINIDAGIKLNTAAFVTDTEPYTLPIAAEVITVMRKPPLNPLTIQRVFQTSPPLINNFIENNAFQFSYRYYYRDGEKSVPAVYSLLAAYNSKTDDFNRIDVVIPITEYIQQDVQRVDLLLKYGNDNTFYEFKSWDKGIPSQATEISNHNAGTQLLTYSFYNDQVGVAQDEAYSLKPFDSIPILSETLEIFDNRLGFANNLEGYNTPYTTSLDATVVDQSEGGDAVGTWIKVIYNSGGSTVYFIYLQDSNNFYSAPYIPPQATVDFMTFSFIALGWGNFTAYVSSHYSNISSITYEGSTSAVTNAPSPISLIGQRCFKSGASYKLSVVFYDFGDRKCGVTGSSMVSGVAMGQATYQIPDRSYDAVTYVTSLNWSLSNLNAINEIPDWATHYSICITRCLLTRFFLQARTKNALHSMVYVNRDSDNVYTFTTNAYSSLLTGVGVDITNLQNFGMGYIFSDGDIVNIYLDGDPTVYRLKIIDQSGRWIICELQDLGTLNDTTPAFFQIYTPYIQSINEPYYEVAQTFPITNYGTTSRQYSAIAGSIRGDVTLLDRGTAPNDYITENMSPNDKYYLNWFTDIGRPNFVDRIGQQLKETSISYSNVLIPGTRTNGLSSFDALDEKSVPQQCGAIMKLQLTSKVQDELGIVMLAICAGGETASLYIGEVQLYGSNAPSTLAQAPNVIGTINILKGNYGTINPETVVEFRGEVFWADANNGKWIQYSANGMDVISSYKMERFWNLWFKQYNSMTSEEIEALGCRPFIFTTVDPYHRELLISIPKLSNTPPKGYLPDYPDRIYPFDILDFQAKTVVYKLGMPGRLPHWQGAYTFYAENFITLQNRLYSFKNGLTWLHNQTDSTNSFYGVNYKSRIACISNMFPQVPKVYNNTSVESNVVPSLVYMYNEYPYPQSSDLVDVDFSILEGIFYAVIYRNKIQPTVNGFNISGLLVGEKMRNIAMLMLYEFIVDKTFLELKFIQVGFDISVGNNNQLNK